MITNHRKNKTGPTIQRREYIRRMTPRKNIRMGSNEPIPQQKSRRDDNRKANKKIEEKNTWRRTKQEEIPRKEKNREHERRTEATKHHKLGDEREEGRRKSDNKRAERKWTYADPQSVEIERRVVLRNDIEIKNNRNDEQTEYIWQSTSETKDPQEPG